MKVRYAVATHLFALIAGAGLLYLISEYRLKSFLENAEISIAATQIQWNTHVLEAINRGELRRAEELLDRQVDTKSANIAGAIAQGGRLDELEVEFIQKAIDQRAARGKSTEALREIIRGMRTP